MNNELLTLIVCLGLNLVLRVVCPNHFVAENLTNQRVRRRSLWAEDDRAASNIVEYIAWRDSRKRVVDLWMALLLRDLVHD